MESNPQNHAAVVLERLAKAYTQLFKTPESRLEWLAEWEPYLRGMQLDDLLEALQSWFKLGTRYPPKPYEFLPLVPNQPKVQKISALPPENYQWWTSNTGIERMARELEIYIPRAATYEDVRELIIEELRRKQAADEVETIVKHLKDKEPED
jgi:hypothetical protein